jgi:hypothetical protein
MNDYMPCDKQDADSVPSFTFEQEDILSIADECGLVWAGFDDDGEMQFVGTTKQFELFEKIKEKI